MSGEHDLSDVELSEIAESAALLSQDVLRLMDYIRSLHAALQRAETDAAAMRGALVRSRDRLAPINLDQKWAGLTDDIAGEINYALAATTGQRILDVVEAARKTKEEFRLWVPWTENSLCSREQAEALQGLAAALERLDGGDSRE